MSLITLAALTIAFSYTIYPSELVDNDFAKRKQEFPDSTIPAYINKPQRSDSEREALKFLFAYMPTPDVALGDTTIFEKSVQIAMQAMDEMPWGATVPHREFMHFVLPMRVNNENLDSCRAIFYNELRDRVRGLSMEEAILEVNHWCHEKVTYKPSDGRTSSPLSTVSQAIGRCGEESTFTVAALRSVGIPARQVYTPRWAHTDDNHAWVEAWANGKWHFIGACEPEPVLDLAWFNDPASRALMMTTNVIGNYDGPEEILAQQPGITTINITSNYAHVDTLNVRVADIHGEPVKDAQVKFCIYNYSDFYPVTTRLTDYRGKTSLLTGIGDMVVWATDGIRYGLATAHPDGNTTTETLNHTPGERSSFDLDIVPPRPVSTPIVVSDSVRFLNTCRLATEDSIRKSYTASFYNEISARAVADALASDSAMISRILTDARGNGQTLASLLTHCRSYMEKPKFMQLLKLLNVVSEKDRRDISKDVIMDNLEDEINPDDEFEVQYILSPRVENEPLSPYKKFFRKNIPLSLQSEIYRNPEALVAFIADSIATDNFNPRRLCMRPADAYKWRRADDRSRAILFVAMARSLGVAARIDPITGKLQYADSVREWRDVNFRSRTTEVAPTGTLRIDYTPAGRLENPKYYSQFSILKIKDGLCAQLDFDESYGVKEISNPTVTLEAGDYILLSSQRQADGSLLSHGEIFTIIPDQEIVVPLKLRRDDNGVSVIGALNAENLWAPADKPDCGKSILSQTGRGYYVIGLISPNDEPTSHALRDIAALKSEFDKLGVPLMLLFADASEASRFDEASYPPMPEKTCYGVDIDSKSLAELKQSLNLPSDLRPVFVIADTFNRVVFATQGYTIGIGDQILDTLHKVMENKL